MKKNHNYNIVKVHESCQSVRFAPVAYEMSAISMIYMILRVVMTLL